VNGEEFGVMELVSEKPETLEVMLPYMLYQNGEILLLEFIVLFGMLKTMMEKSR